MRLGRGSSGAAGSAGAAGPSRVVRPVALLMQEPRTQRRDGKKAPADDHVDPHGTRRLSSVGVEGARTVMSVHGVRRRVQEHPTRSLRATLPNRRRAVKLARPVNDGAPKSTAATGPRPPRGPPPRSSTLPPITSRARVGKSLGPERLRSPAGPDPAFRARSRSARLDGTSPYSSTGLAGTSAGRSRRHA